MSKKPVLSAVVAVAAVYMAYPYVALYQLDSALRRGDSGKLAAMIDWDQVREGLTDDICDGLIAEPAGAKPAANSATTLPPFGASFMKGIAANAVDSAVTPETLVRLVSHKAEAADGNPRPPQSLGVDGAHVKWAFFDSPSTFSLWVHTADEPPDEDPVKLRMQLIDGSWMITRVWLPPAMLKRARSPG
jgi:hypothetical protein